MITVKEVESIHDILIEKFGGGRGIRDYAILDSAINRPFQTFDQGELYPTPIEKAAAIFESIITNHPFVDGNKRTAYVLMRLMLLNYSYDIEASESEKYSFVLSAATGQSRFEEIRKWISAHLVTKGHL
jgi:death on curing protein